MNARNVLMLSKGLKPDPPDPSRAEILWAKKIAESALKEITIFGNPLSFFTKKAQTAISTKISMEPIQDLHGYDYPWPAGGGVNIFNVNDVSLLQLETASRYGVMINDPGTYTLKCYNVPSTSNFKINARLKYGNSWGDTKRIIYYTFTDTVTFTISDASTSMYIYAADGSYSEEDAKAVFTNSQFQVSKTNGAPYRYYSYSNICPISGRTSVSLNGCGKNLLNVKSYTIPNINDSRRIWSGKFTGTFTISLDTSEVTSVIYPSLTFMYWIDENGTRHNCSYRDFPITLTGTILSLFIYGSQAYARVSGKITVQMEVGSEATEYESYQSSNEITISFPALGANQWDEEWEVKNVSGQQRVCNKNPIPVVAGRRLYIKCPVTAYFNAVNSSGSYLSYIGYAKNGPLTIPENVKYISFSVLGDYGTVYNHDISINYPSTITTYEPYTNTVYGGTVNLETGECKINTSKVDVSTLNWMNTSTNGMFYADDDLSELKGTGKTIITCDSLRAVDNVSDLGSASLNPDCSICGFSNTQSLVHRFYIKWISMGNNVTNLKNALNGAYAIYELATPCTISLTPEQVQLLKGHNMIWTDGDSIKLTYKS